MFRSPDSAKIKPKMLYASSKDALRKKLVGVASEIQCTDLSEIAYDTVLEKVAKQVSFILSGTHLLSSVGLSLESNISSKDSCNSINEVAFTCLLNLQRFLQRLKRSLLTVLLRTSML